MQDNYDSIKVENIFHIVYKVNCVSGSKNLTCSLATGPGDDGLDQSARGNPDYRWGQPEDRGFLHHLQAQRADRFTRVDHPLPQRQELEAEKGSRGGGEGGGVPGLVDSDAGQVIVATGRPGYRRTAGRWHQFKGDVQFLSRGTVG